MTIRPINPSRSIAGVRYEIRGHLARRAHELEKLGYEVLHLNIGNPGRFGFRTPETMRLAMIENMQASEGYCHQKGIFPAREAVVMQQQSRGIMGVSSDEVFIGNGVSELIDLTLRALLDPGDEVLIPAPDYPLWSAAVTLNGGRPVYYDCPPDNAFLPDLDQVRSAITDKTRAIVIISPNNPTGAVYPRETLEALARIAEEAQIVVFSDEIYDQMLYEDARHIPLAQLVHNTLCATFGGLSKVYRACGYRVGWVSFSGEREHAQGYLDALELLASLRLCSNVPGQWAVQTALGGYQSIYELTREGGRLHKTRQAVIDAVDASRYLTLHAPMGAMYAFPGVRTDVLPGFDDQQFAMDLLEQKHVLIAPGNSFNVAYRNHFRLTLLPEPAVIDDIFGRIDELLRAYEADL